MSPISPGVFAAVRDLSQWLFAWISAGFIESVVVLAVVIAFFRLCGNRLSPRIGLWLFFLVLLKPLVPFSFSLPNHLAVWTPSGVTQTVLNSRSWIPESDSSISLQTTFSQIATERTHVPYTLQAAPSGTESLAAQNEAHVALNQDIESRVTVDSNHNPITAVSLSVDHSIHLADGRLDWRVAIGIIYLIVVVILYGNFTIRQFMCARAIRIAQPIPTGGLNIDLDSLRQIANVRRSVRVVELRGITSPAIWGIRNPTLVLPSQLWRSLSPEQMKWIVLHEFAHVYRHDVVIQFVQRCLLIFQFWNPCAWVANYLINRCREDDCDDLALQWSERNSISAGEAFMIVARYATTQVQRRSTVIPAAVALFSISSRQACMRRLSRLLDADRKLNVRHGLGAFLMVIMASILLLPNIRPVAVAQVPSQRATPIDSVKTASTFELRVVGPTGLPIPNAEVEIRSNPKSKWDVLVGRSLRDGTYGQFARVDENGVLTVNRHRDEPKNVSFSILAPGFAPFIAQWSFLEKSEILPTNYTAKLEAGQSIGGMIVDEDGNPVGGAKVRPSVEFTKRAEDKRQLGVGNNYMTDADGRWRIDTVPASNRTQQVAITHPSFMPITLNLNSSQYQLAVDEQPSKRIEMSRGLTLTGKVLDRDGEPIPRAIVRTQLRNETLQATTDEQGVYRLLRCAEGSADIAVTAEKYGPSFKAVNIRAEMPPVEFVLLPGKTIRVRVTDAQGNPLPRTVMFFQRWRDKTNFPNPMGMTSKYTDENGIWKWDSAPEDALLFDVCPPSSMQIVNQSLVAREEEYHFVATPQLSITGVVRDAVTKQPIDRFHVTPGARWIGRAEPFWNEDQGFDGSGGSFQTVSDRVDGTKLLEVKAAGYALQTSRDIKWDEGSINVEFLLTKSNDVVVQLLQPGGRPAVRAEAALGVGDTQIEVSHGKFGSSTFAERAFADEAGRINLGGRTKPLGLVVVHETGYAEAIIDPTKLLEPITLIAWGKVEGQLHVGKNVGANLAVVLNYNQFFEGLGGFARVRHDNESTTDNTGKFSFGHLVPAPASIGTNVVTHASRTGNTSAQSHRRIISIEPAKTTSIELGGIGHRVIGKLLAPAGTKDTIDWEYSRVTIRNAIGEYPPVPYPVELATEDERSNWFQAWRTTPEALPWTAAALAFEEQRRLQVRYMCGVEDDGTFEIHDLPSGAYALDFKLDQAGKSGGPTIGSLKLDFQIDADNTQRTTVDLGELQTQKPN